MNLTNYIKGLFKTFKRDSVVDSCTQTGQMIKEHTLPAYEAAAVLFKSNGFKSKEGKDFASIYSKKVDRNTDMITSVKNILSNTLVLLDHISNVAKNEFSQTEASVVLTYKKSTYLRTISCAEFLSTYSRSLLNYIYSLETDKANGTNITKDSILKIEISYIVDNFLSFCDVCKVLHTDKKDYDRLVSGIPDIVISELTELTLPETLGDKKIDPLMMKNISVSWNPFYHIGLAIAAYQVDKYKQAKSQSELLQMRKLNLEKINQNEPDARLQKEIEYLQNRVDGLNYKIQKFEEENSNA